MTLDRDPSGRPPAGADFEATRVTGARRRPSIAIVGWLVVLTGFVAIGLSGRSPEATGIDANRAEVAAATSAVGPSGSARPLDIQISRRFDPAFPGLIVVESGESGALALVATRRPSAVAIHGNVFAQQVSAVLFTMQGLDGDVARSIALNVPALLADGRNRLPSWPMDVELAIPTALAATALVIEADVYGPGGARIDRIRLRLAPEM